MVAHHLKCALWEVFRSRNFIDHIKFLACVEKSAIKVVIWENSPLYHTMLTKRVDLSQQNSSPSFFRNSKLHEKEKSTIALPITSVPNFFNSVVSSRTYISTAEVKITLWEIPRSKWNCGRLRDLNVTLLLKASQRYTSSADPLSPIARINFAPETPKGLSLRGE